jgi:hypothetical protein
LLVQYIFFETNNRGEAWSEKEAGNSLCCFYYFYVLRKWAGEWCTFISSTWLFLLIVVYNVCIKLAQFVSLSCRRLRIELSNNTLWAFSHIMA